MADILFGQSYYLRFDAKLWKAMQPYPPLGCLYAASLARAHGYTVALFDAMLAESEEEWRQALQAHRPRYAVLFEDNFNYLSKMCLLRMRQAALAMMAIARQAHCTVIVCGADASDHPELYLSGGADYVLVGEGEITLMELLEQLRSGGAPQPERLLGVAWKDAAGQLQRTPRRPDIRDLDSLPFPAWDLVDMARYRRIWLERHGYFALNLVTTRGCPFHCNWCAKPIWGQRYHSRSPENVVAEMKQLVEAYQPDFINFVDDIFGLKPGWLDGFAAALQAAGLKVPFKCLSRVDLLLRPGEIEALQRAGARLVWVGAESGAQKILDAMDKGTRVEQIYAAAGRLRQAGIQVGFFLQFGYPGETLEDIQKTFQMVRDCLPDDIGVSVSYPLPGTRFHQAVRDQLGEQRNWYDSQDLAMLYHGPYTTAFYRQLHTALHCEFRMRKAWEAFRSGAKPALANTPPLPGARRPSPLRQLLRAAYYAARLPWERWRMRSLAIQPAGALTALPLLMTPEEAARPSPQAE